LSLSDLFFHTGGVPRYVTQIDPKYTELKEQQLREALDRDYDLLEVFIQLSRADFDPQKPWNLESLQDDNTIDPSKYYEWIESSLIFRNLNAQFQFLFPWHADFMKKPYSPTDMSNVEWLAAKSILQKPGDKCAGDVFGDYIAKKILVKKLLAQKHVQFITNPIQTDEIDELTIEDFVSKYRIFSREQGIDGVIFEVVTEDTYTCSCFQLKTSSAHYPHPIKSGTNPMSLTNILAKFKAGSAMLHMHLKEVLKFDEDEKLVFKFYLVSTGELRPKEKQFLTTFGNCKDFLERDVPCQFISVWKHLPKQLAKFRKDE